MSDTPQGGRRSVDVSAGQSQVWEPVTSAPANPIRFAGEYRDESGLYNVRSRLYDPSNGRFTSEKPVPSEQAEPSMSAYAYADNRPKCG